MLECRCYVNRCSSHTKVIERLDIAALLPPNDLFLIRTSLSDGCSAIGNNTPEVGNQEEWCFKT